MLRHRDTEARRNTRDSEAHGEGDTTIRRRGSGSNGDPSPGPPRKAPCPDGVSGNLLFVAASNPLCLCASWPSTGLHKYACPRGCRSRMGGLYIRSDRNVRWRAGESAVLLTPAWRSIPQPFNTLLQRRCRKKNKRLLVSRLHGRSSEIGTRFSEPARPESSWKVSEGES